MTAKRFVVAAGGTGGHILPGIRIGEQLGHTAQGEYAVEYVCGQRPIEQTIYTGEGITPTRLLAGGLQNLGPAGKGIELAIDTVRMLASFIARRPTAVLAMGGAACFPVLTAARALGIPIFLHESNRIPGRVTLMFRSAARKVFLGLGGLTGRNVELTGTPTRSAKIDESRRDVVLCVGGSQGATSLNQAFLGAVDQIAADFPQIRFILISGPGKLPAHSGKAEVREYESDLPSLLARCIVIVSRSGAGALADIANFRIPSILVPYPHAKDNHQHANASVYSEAGAAALIDEAEMTPAKIAETVTDFLKHADRRRDSSAMLAKFDSSQSAEIICRSILQELPARPTISPLSQGHRS